VKAPEISLTAYIYCLVYFVQMNLRRLYDCDGFCSLFERQKNCHSLTGICTKQTTLKQTSTRNCIMTNVMHKFLIYLSIYFCLTCFGLPFSQSSGAGVQILQWFKSPGAGLQILQWFKSPGYGVSAWVRMEL
jgi:hypothetical protein